MSASLVGSEMCIRDSCILIRRVVYLRKCDERHQGFRAKLTHLLDVYRRAEIRGTATGADAEQEGPAAP
eukprot:8301906-Alexandrium_andersonii.AAC.1